MSFVPSQQLPRVGLRPSNESLRNALVFVVPKNGILSLSEGGKKVCNFSCYFLFRSWDKVCVVLRGNQIGFYKDQKSWRTSPEATYRGEPPIDIAGGQAEVATDYTKKRNVFRLR